jgi:hypothetical protein
VSVDDGSGGGGSVRGGLAAAFARSTSSLFVRPLPPTATEPTEPAAEGRRSAPRWSSSVSTFLQRRLHPQPPTAAAAAAAAAATAAEDARQTRDDWHVATFVSAKRQRSAVAAPVAAPAAAVSTVAAAEAAEAEPKVIRARRASSSSSLLSLSLPLSLSRRAASPAPTPPPPPPGQMSSRTVKLTHHAAATDAAPTQVHVHRAPSAHALTPPPHLPPLTRSSSHVWDTVSRSLRVAADDADAAATVTGHAASERRSVSLRQTSSGSHHRLSPAPPPALTPPQPPHATAAAVTAAASSAAAAGGGGGGGGGGGPVTPRLFAGSHTSHHKSAEIALVQSGCHSQRKRSYSFPCHDLAMWLTETMEQAVV